jgi:maleylacetoacetate isomerase
VPALQLPTGEIITQSLAIIDYLETSYPSENLRLLPTDNFLRRANIFEIVYAISCDIHPVQNMRVLRRLPENQRNERAKVVIESGLVAVEVLLSRYSGTYCVGDELSLADICLVPQVYNAKRYNVDIERLENISRINSFLETLPEFYQTRPESQIPNII